MQSLVKIFTCILLVEKAASLSTGMSRMKSTDGLSLEELVGLGAQSPPIPLSAEAESDVAQLLGSLEVKHANTKSNGGQAGVNNTSGLGTNATNTVARTTNTSGEPRQLEHVFLFKQPSGSIDPTRPYDVPMISNSDKSMTLNSQKITSFAYNEISSGPSMTRVFAVTLVMLVVALVFVALCIFVMEEHSEADEGPMAAKPPEDLYVMMSCDGTWATTYQRSEGPSKQALELLFRCHIIPNEEFAHSRVSQEHIDECVWIASHMLRQRKLEEWTEMWPEALRTFEESVTACFAARTDVRTEFAVGTEDEPVQGAPRKAGSSVGSPRALHYLGSSADVASRPPSDTMSPSGNMPASGPASGARSLNNSPTKGKYTAPSSRKEANDVLPPVLGTPADRKSLMDRCRQIMAASDAQRKPRSAGAAPIDTSHGSNSAAGRNVGYGKSSSPSTNV